METTFLLTLCSLSLFFCSASRVPVLLGSTGEVSAQHSPVRAGHVVRTSDLRRFVEPFFSTELHCLVVFDELKLSDFAVHGDAYSPDGYGSVFRHTKELLEGARSAMSLPAVDSSETSPVDVARSVLRQMNPSLHVQHLSPTTAEEVGTLQYSAGKPTLWVVHLPSVSSDEARLSTLRKSDAIIGGLRRQLSRFGHFSFTITSKRGESVAEEAQLSTGQSRASARHLLATNVDSSEVVEEGNRRCTLVCYGCTNTTSNANHTGPCSSPAVMMCYRNITLKFTSTVSNDTQTLDTGKNASTRVTIDPDVMGCPVTLSERLRVSMDLESTNASVTVKATLDFHFQLTKGFPVMNNSANASYWELVTVTASHDNFHGSGSACLFPPSIESWVYAPLNQSYNCMPKTVWTKAMTFRGGNLTADYQPEYCPGKSDSVNVEMTLEGLQVQAYVFTTPPNKMPFFDQAADCVGYFTGTTWMGIIVVSLLMIVVFLTTLAFLATDTPDRFDDPKGKNIQVQ